MTDAEANEPDEPDETSMLAGVTLEDCAEVSRDASAVLDAGNLIPHSYHLEGERIVRLSLPDDRRPAPGSEFKHGARACARDPAPVVLRGR